MVLWEVGRLFEDLEDEVEVGGGKKSHEENSKEAVAFIQVRHHH